MTLRLPKTALMVGVLLLMLVLQPAMAGSQLMLVSQSVSLSSQLDFGVISPTSGSISFAGDNAPLVGTDIEVDEIVGLDTPDNSHVVMPIVDGVLNFVSGTLASSTGYSWDFSGGGTIEIRGEIPSLGIGPDSVLMTGSFDSISVIAGFADFRVAVAAFNDEKHDGLEDFYGAYPGMTYDGNMNLSFLANAAPPGSFTSSITLSGDVVNTGQVIPLPAAAWMGLLLLSGSFCLRLVRRRDAFRRR